MTDIKRIPMQGLTPEKIAGKLFSFHDKAHFLHLQTTSFSKHKMLDKLYKGLVDSKDSICEYLLGIQVPKRFTSLLLDPVGAYSDQAVEDFLDEGFDFSIELCKYAKSNNLEQLCNLSSELQGLFVSSKYLNSLK